MHKTISASITAGLLMTAIPVWADDMSCDNGSFTDRFLCFGVYGFVIAASGTVIAADVIENATSSGASVSVELDDGTVVPGTITSKATQGRVVKTGDLVRLDCTKAFQNTPASDAKTCELRFLKKDYLGNPYPKPYEMYAAQQSLSIEVSQDGAPNKDLLVLENSRP